MFHASRGVVIQLISYHEPLRMHVDKDFMQIKRPLYWKKKNFKQKRSIYNKINAEVISKTNAKLTKKWNIATIFPHWRLVLQWRRFQMTVEMPLLSLKISRQFFNQWEAPSTRDFSRALSKLQEIASNSDWFVALFALVVIGRSLITLGFLFRQSLENHSITHETEFCSRITKPRR